MRIKKCNSIFLIIVIIMISGCSKDPQNKLIGNWMIENGSITISDESSMSSLTYKEGTYIEFFENNKVIFQGDQYISGTYEIFDEKKIELNLGKADVYHYSFEGDRLILYSPINNETCNLIKTADLENEVNNENSDDNKSDENSKYSESLIGVWQITDGDLTIYEDSFGTKTTFDYGSFIEFFDDNKILISVKLYYNGTYEKYDDEKFEMNFGKSNVYEYSFEEDMLRIYNPEDDETCYLIRNDFYKSNATIADINYSEENRENYSNIPIGDNIKMFKFGYVPVRIGNQMGLIDSTGNWALEPTYDLIYDFEPNGLARVMQNNKWGYIDVNIQPIIKPQFAMAYNFDKIGFASVLTFEDNAEKLINSKGNFILEKVFNAIGGFSEKEIALASPKDNPTKLGVINTNGDWIIEPKYEIDSWWLDFNKLDIIWIGKYVDGKLKYGLLNSNGTELTDFIYDEVSYHDKNGFTIGWIKNGDRYSSKIIDSNGSVVYDGIDQDISISNTDNRFYLYDSKSSNYGIINSKGERITDTVFKQKTYFYNNIAVAVLEDRIVIIDSNGRILKTVYENLGSNSWLSFTIDNNYFSFGDTNSMYYANLDGDLIGPLPEANSYINGGHYSLSKDLGRKIFFVYSDGYAIYWNKEKFGIIDLNGNYVTDAIFDEIRIDNSLVTLKDN